MFSEFLRKKVEPEPALRLLVQLAPDTPWVLRAQRGKGAPVIVTLRPEQRAEAAQFVTDQLRAGRALAVLTAEPAITLNRLPAPTDLRGTRYFGVSITLPADRQSGDGKARAALRTLVERLKPKPFMLIATLRGYECWWRLFNLLPPERAQIVARQWAERIPGALPLDVFLDLPSADRTLVRLDKDATALLTDFLPVPAESDASAPTRPVTLDKMDSRPVDWLCPQVAANGKLNLVGGLPGTGKSTWTLAVAAALSVGRSLTGEKIPVGNVLILAIEDDAADTIKPRLQAAGADLRRIVVDNADYDLRQGADILIRRAEDVGAKLIIFDPIDSYIEGPAVTVRRHLTPLIAWAARTGTCLLAIIHPPKGVTGKSVQELFGGSAAFARIARSAWIAFPAEGGGLFLYAKGNIVKDKRGFAYRFEEVVLPNGIETSRVVLEPERLQLTADEFLAGKRGEAAGTKSKAPAGDQPVFDASNAGRGDSTRGAVEWLRTALTQGPREGKALKAEAEAAGFHHPVLYRAKAALGVKIRPSGFGKSKLWEL